MTFNFSSEQFVKTIEPSTEESVGTISPNSVREITKVRGRFYIHDVDVGMIRAKIVRVGTDSTEVVVGTSEWVDIENVEDKGTYWIGWLRFEFDKNIFIGNGQEIQLRFETNAYTYDEDNNYIAMCSSVPIKSTNDYGGSGFTDSPYDFELYEVI